ncbi:MAG: nitroreductase family protein [Bdellovibrionales bacterium]|nr:nitroreductase family protein [Bdellovibrionales bacterium]
MNIEELIKNRRTAQQFKKDPIDFNLVHKAIELMAYAPNHKHTFPWGAYRLSSEEKNILINLLVEKKLKKVSNPTPVQVSAVRQNFENIPEMVALLQKKQEDAFTQKEDYASLACGVQILSLYLWQHDIACKWSTTGMMNNESFKQATQIDWNQWDIEGLVFIGKAARIPQRPERPRVLINETT